MNEHLLAMNIFYFVRMNAAYEVVECWFSYHLRAHSRMCQYMPKLETVLTVTHEVQIKPTGMEAVRMGMYNNLTCLLYLPIVLRCLDGGLNICDYLGHKFVLTLCLIEQKS
jgi:hypothetical protein